MNDNILDEQQFGSLASRRLDLLPLWIKVFIWIFLIFGTIVPVILVLGIIGINFNLSLYGLETTQPLSLIGLLITILFALKGIVAFGLWMEKEWAIKMAIIDGVVGIIVCIFMMAILPFIFADNGVDITFRLEILFLIPYLLKMREINSKWVEKLN